MGLIRSIRAIRPAIINLAAVDADAIRAGELLRSALLTSTGSAEDRPTPCTVRLADVVTITMRRNPG
jgi:hypothetical protein